jgi:hypothetical protein
LNVEFWFETVLGLPLVAILARKFVENRIDRILERKFVENHEMTVGNYL